MSVTVTSYIDGTAVSPTRTDPHAESFRDVINTTQSGKYGWLSQQVVDNTRIVFSRPGEPSRYQNGTLKVTVKPNDHPIASVGERSELLWMLNSSGDDENGSSGTQYYGVSLYLPSSWVDTSGWCIPVQLHGPDNAGSSQNIPVFALDVSKVPNHYTLTQAGGDNSAVIRLDTDLGTHVYDTWVDFLFKVTWAIDNTGATSVWTRTGGVGQLVAKQVGTGTTITPWNTPTLYSAGGVALSHYWKRGLYRNPEVFASTLYASSFSRAANEADAAWAAFGQWP